MEENFLPKPPCSTADTKPAATRTAGSIRVKMMTAREYFEQKSMTIATLGREELIRRIRNFNGRFKLDFSREYLSKLSVDRLRHILLAALVNAGPRN